MARHLALSIGAAAAAATADALSARYLGTPPLGVAPLAAVAGATWFSGWRFGLATALLCLLLLQLPVLSQAEPAGAGAPPLLASFLALTAGVVVLCQLASSARRDRAAALELVRTSDQRMADGVALLAHELRNPLAAVRSAVDLVRRTPDPDLLRSTACRMERQLAHLGRLIEDLLESARLDRGKARLSLRRLAVDSLVNDAISLATPYTAPARQQVVVALDNDLGSIDVDADKIIQVLGNLLHNASKFSPAGSTITVRGASTGADVVIAVRDAGIGIEPQYLERIFSRYAQVESGAHNGLGLGLSLARQWMELHGGKIVARSSGPGAGAEFVLTFRRTPPAHPDEVGASPRPIAPLQVRQPSGHTPEWMRRPLPLSPFPFIRTRQALPHVPTSGQASASTTNEAGV